MNLASFFSGGKDSTYAAFLAKHQGHTIRCLLTAFPNSDESPLLHHPNTFWTKLQAQSMNMPQLTACTTNSEDEVESLECMLEQARNDFGITGLVHGGISSQFQKTKFDDLCKKCNLTPFAPLWKKDPSEYMSSLLKYNFEYIITSVSSGGLDDSWLGRTITKKDVDILTTLSKKHGFNLNFEGGEAETFVTNCPMFSNPIRIQHGEKFWDGYRGRFEIVDAMLDRHA